MAVFVVKDDVDKAVYSACLAAAIALGDDLKGLSWFGKSGNRTSLRKVA